METNCFVQPNPQTPCRVIVIDPDKCVGCNTCVEVCRTDVLVPNPEKKKPPIPVYVDECWFCGCCIEHCPKSANRMVQPLNQCIGWKRKATGEYFRIGMTDPPEPNTRPRVGG